MRFVTYQDRKKVAADLKPVYRAVNADAAETAPAAFDEKWGQKYPMIAASWRTRWEHIIPFLALPADLRRAAYTTNSIETPTVRSARASRPAGTSPTNRPRPSSSTSPSNAPNANGAAPTTGPPRSEASRSASQTDSPD
jgi:putative transposase